MRTKLMLEALAASLVLAAVSGQACASMQTGANGVFGANTVLMLAKPMVADPGVSLDHGITTPYPGGKISANGGIRANADIALLTPPAATRNGTSTRPASGVHAPARGPFRADASRSTAAFGFSHPDADDFAPSRRNGYGTELTRRAVFSQHDVARAPQGVLAAATGGSELDAEKFYVVADAKPATGSAVPEPGSWATVLAGLLGAIAIARRRMSL